jgi:3-methyladenine DNA glycosylase AlkD
MTSAEILQLLASRPDLHAVAGMARFGIVAKKVHGGWAIPELKKLAREIGHTHALAQELWASEVFEARMLATLIDEPAKVTRCQLNQWAKDFDNWAICDGACINLFRYTKIARQMCMEWSGRPHEFVKRAAFALMAGLTVADKVAGDEMFLEFLPLIKRAATDERKMVMKGVNWALRQIGKRNARLNRSALAAADEIYRLDSRAARWIASDARRELESPAVQQRLNGRTTIKLRTKVQKQSSKGERAKRQGGH